MSGINSFWMWKGLVFGFFLANAHGAGVVLDSFSSSDFTLSLDGVTERATVNTGPIGTQRTATISNRDAASGTIFASTFDSTGGSLSTLIDQSGTGMAVRPLDLALRYSRGGSYSISGYSSIDLDFTEIEGVGNLIIELGGQSDSYGPSTHRIPLNGPGTVSVPFDQLNFSPGGSLGSFIAFNVVFEAASPDFSFTLEEIRIVPEPSSLLLLGIGGMALSFRRGRRAEVTAGSV